MKFGIYQSQLSRAWCLRWPDWGHGSHVEWFDTWCQARDRFVTVIR